MGSQQLRALSPGPGNGFCSSTGGRFCRAGFPPGTGEQAASGESWGSGRHTGRPWSTQGARALERKHLLSYKVWPKHRHILHKMFSLYIFLEKDNCVFGKFAFEFENNRTTAAEGGKNISFPMSQ